MKLSALLKELIKTLNASDVEHCQVSFDRWAYFDAYGRPCGCPLYLLFSRKPFLMQDYLFFIHVGAGKGRPIYLAENSSEEKPTPYYDYEAVTKLIGLPHEGSYVDLAKLLFSRSTYDSEFLDGGDWYLSEAYEQRFKYVLHHIKLLEGLYKKDEKDFTNNMPYKNTEIGDSSYYLAYAQLCYLVDNKLV